MTADGAPQLSRRTLLASVPVAGVGAAAALGIDATGRDAPAAAPAIRDAVHGTGTVLFHGTHQAGVDIAPQAHQNLVALTLQSGVTGADLGRLFQVLTDDAARMMSGTYALADAEPEFAATPARLSITLGVGPKVVSLLLGSAAVPSWLGPLPAFPIDRLDPAWSDGDLVLQVASDDPITLAHATRMVLKDCRSFAAVHWYQHGFRNARGSLAEGRTMRNLMGLIDGTVNPTHGSDELASVVWRSSASDAPWLEGGTTMVVRRVRMLLDKWDRLDRSGREAAIGRRMANGAPLTGQAEHDEPDFEATTPIGFPVIPEFSHLRRARGDGKEHILRRGYNYELGGHGSEVSDAGLIFQSFQADLEVQFLPIQQRLAELDLLNEWTTPIGSAVFAVLPGCGPDGHLGETLF